MNNFTINLDKKTLTLDDNTNIGLDTAEGFEIIKKIWQYTNWANRYSYNFTWLGRPIIQLPDDMLRIQEIIYQIKPTLIIETGIAHGGSLIFYASLLNMIGKGRVVGVDIDIREHNRKEIENHALFPSITLFEGSSIDTNTVNKFKETIQKDDIVLVILDSCHTKQHVLQELEIYADFVSQNSYIIVADGIMQEVVGAPGAEEDWEWNNPQEAVKEFLQTHQNFVNEPWKPLFHESDITSLASYYQNGFLRRI